MTLEHISTILLRAATAARESSTSLSTLSRELAAAPKLVKLQETTKQSATQPSKIGPQINEIRIAIRQAKVAAIKLVEAEVKTYGQDSSNMKTAAVICMRVLQDDLERFDKESLTTAASGDEAAVAEPVRTEVNYDGALRAAVRQAKVEALKLIGAMQTKHGLTGAAYIAWAECRDEMIQNIERFDSKTKELATHAEQKEQLAS